MKWILVLMLLASPALATTPPQPLLPYPVSDENSSIIQRNTENIEYHRNQLYNGTASLEVKSVLINGSSPASGPSSSTDNAIARFDGTTGKIIQNSTRAILNDASSLEVVNLCAESTIEAGLNIYSQDWTSYGADSTIVGWSSFTRKQIYYKRIGKMVFCQFLLTGTSNATTTTFTLPILIKRGVNDGYAYFAIGFTMNNGANEACGVGFYNGFTATLRRSASAAWTNSGEKAVYGEFFFEAE